jgi:hypothetical protein
VQVVACFKNGQSQLIYLDRITPQVVERQQKEADVKQALRDQEQALRDITQREHEAEEAADRRVKPAENSTKSSSVLSAPRSTARSAMAA